MERNLRKMLILAFVFSGMAALIYEVTWIRPLQLLLGSTTYTISIILAVFMLGLALGSGLIAKHIDNIKNLPQTYALLEIGIGLYGVLLLSIFNWLPGIYDSLYFLHANFYLFETVQFLLIFLVLLIPTTLMGATFPVIAKYYTKEKIGKGIGEVYSANNIGAIIGSFSAGFLLIPLIGIKGSIIFAGTINIIIGSFILWKTDLVDKADQRNKADKGDFYKFINKKTISILSISLFLVLAYFGNYNIQQMHSGGFYKVQDMVEVLDEVVYYQEGAYATVSVIKVLPKGYSLFINGKGQGSYGILDLRVNLLLANLPILIKPEIKNSLVVGLGTGTTSGQLAQTSRVTTIELEPAVIGATEYFKLFNRDVLKNPNHKLKIDDGRNYLLRNEEIFDAIIQEPSDPWQSFSSYLYSKEYFELVKGNLQDDGLFIKWVPIYTMSTNDFKNFYKTFSFVFPYNIGFANIKLDEDTPVKFETSELILIGSKKEIKFNEELLQKNYNDLPEISRQSLDSIRLSSGNEVYHLLLFTNEQMDGYTDEANLITDDNLILEFSTARNVLNQNPKEVIDDVNDFIR